MKFEGIEREAFETFGEVEAIDSARPHEITDFDALERQAANDHGPIKAKGAFSWAGFAGGLAALVWIGAAIGGPLSYFGAQGVMAMDPAMQAGLIALAIGPALLFWLGASAAGEAMKARSFAAELARIARNAKSPIEESEAQARKLSHTVKLELETLNDAVADAMNRLGELETLAQRNARLFDGAISAARDNAQFMTSQLEQERHALASMSADMRGQTESMAHSIGRQVRLLREASSLVKSEVSAAEGALETHLSSFAASAHAMGEHTSAFHHAAENATAVTHHLNGVMANMLEGLSEATRLTDTARQAAGEAVHAANETAGAVRETTRSAVFEAKRAAQLIRAEAQALQEAASDTMARLQAAAEAARAASDHSKSAADHQAERIERRLGAIAAAAAPSRSDAERAPPRAKPSPQPPAPRPHALKGFNMWVSAAPKRPTEECRTREESNPHDVSGLVEFGSTRANADDVLKADAVDVVLAAGVDLGRTLAPADLEAIAQRSRKGAAARRLAVSEAAPAAVSRLSRHITRHGVARDIANDFRARPALTQSEDKRQASDLVRAYLLIDAALG